MAAEQSDSVQKVRTFADDFARAQATQSTAQADTETLTRPAAKQTAPAAPVAAADAEITTPPTPVREDEDTFIDVDTGTPQPKTAELDDDLESVEFVREKKDNRFRLFPEIKRSMQGWYDEKKEDLTAIPPESQVEDPSKRTDTIDAAVHASALPESEDYQTVAGNIAAQPKVTAENTLSITRTDELPAPQWSSSLEAGKVAPTQATPVVAPEPEPEPEPTPTPVEPEPVAMPVVRETPAPAPEPIAAPEPEPTYQAEQAFEPEPAAVTVPTPAPVASPETTQRTPAPTYQYRATPTEPVPRDWRWWLVIASVCIAAIVLGLTVSMWVYQYLAQPERVLAPDVPSAITADDTVAVALTGSSYATLTEMRNVLSTAGGQLVQTYPIVATSEGGTRVATIDEFLAVAPISADGSFQRNITNLTFFGINPTTVGIIVEFTSFEAALGGMYGWESRLVSDYGAFLGDSPTTQFVDTTVANRDIRVAKRDDNTELLYSFIDQNTLLIATDRSLVGEVITRQK